MKILFISDFFVDDIIGGAELVDATIINYLKKDEDVKLTCKKSLEVTIKEIIENDFLIISNISLLNQNLINFIKENKKYLIVEHDYKIHPSRQPWRFKDSIVPVNERHNYDFYSKAKAVFLQTSDHLKVFNDNNVNANLINLNCSIWSEEELTTLDLISKEKKTHKFAIVDSDNFIKNKNGAEQFCKINKIDYEIVPKLPPKNFLQTLSGYPALVFFPIARESCCRLIVEAKCMNMNIITNNNSGAFKSDWYKMHGTDLISYLRNTSKNNLNNIKNYTR